MTQDRQKAKENRILHAAISVFAEKGYHGSSIADIAGEAKVATGTIYLYFAHKEDLLTAIFQRYLGSYLKEVTPDLVAQPPGLPQLRRLVDLHLKFFQRDMSLARVFQIHMREVNPVIRDGIRPTMMDYFDLIDRVIGGGVACGDFDPELDTRLARQFFFGGLDQVVTSWVVTGGKFDLVSIADQAYAMLARAFGAEPSRLQTTPARQAGARSGPAPRG